MESSSVNPNTKRFQYLQLPNASVELLGRPGYSGSGIVRGVAPGVEDTSQGARVTIIGAPRASSATVPAGKFVSPSSAMEFASASLPRQPLTVVSANLIGALTAASVIARQVRRR
jgi:NADPH:quinone reductase-like Zn-dependent oxidoreductase